MPRGRLALLRAAAVLMMTAGLTLGPGRAIAQLIDVPETGQPGYLQLAADPYPADFGSLAPGQSVPWLIEASLADAESSTLSLQLRGWGGLVDHLNGLKIAVETCPTAYTGEEPTCHHGGTTVVAPAPLASVATPTTSDTWTLPDLVRAEPRHFLVELSLPASAAGDATLQSLEGNVAVGLYASGTEPVEPPVVPEEPTPTVPEEQPTTGPDRPSGPVPGEPDVTAPGKPGVAPPGQPDVALPGQPGTATPGVPGSLPSTGASVLSIALVAVGAIVLGLSMRRHAAAAADI